MLSFRLLQPSPVLLGHGMEDRVNPSCAILLPLHQIVCDTIVEFREAVNRPEVLARARESAIVEEEIVVVCRLHQRVAAVEHVVEVGLEVGPALTNLLQSLANELQFRSQLCRFAEGIHDHLGCVEADLGRLARKPYVMFVEEATGRHHQ